MKKQVLVKLAGITIGIIILPAIGALTYFSVAYPKAERVPAIKVKSTPARLARGKYLANHVTGCIDCHSERDWTRYGGPLIPGSRGKGGEKFNLSDGGETGVVYSKNITPSGIGDWSDGELIRAITTGVTQDGTALFPLMPYRNFNHLTQEDLYSLIVYLRSLKPIANPVPDRVLRFPLNLLVKTMPLSSYNPARHLGPSDSIRYGKYLATIAGCGDCHTQMVQGKPVLGMEFAGGREFNLPCGTVRSTNITPDVRTGIGNWNKQQFVAFFKSFDSDKSKPAPVRADQFNTVMPITFYAGMTTNDLGAIYGYLRTLKPVHHRIVRFTPTGHPSARKGASGIRQGFLFGRLASEASASLSGQASLDGALGKKTPRSQPPRCTFNKIIPARYFTPKMESLAALATRNLTTFLAGILIC